MEFIDVVKEGVASVGRAFTRPDEDWLPALFYLDQFGTMNVTMVVWGDEEQKDEVCDYIRDTLREKGAKEAAFVGSAFGREFTPEGTRDFELVQLIHVDESRTRATTAAITRRPDAPPALGPWDHMAEGFNVGGQFADAMRAGMA